MSASPDVEPLTIEGHWNFKYEYFAGETASRFFAELRNGRIMATVCPSCERVLVPARGHCDVCYVSAEGWREVATEGTLESFTILATKFDELPDPPVVIGYVTLDGASTAVLNFVRGVDLGDLDAAGAALLAQPRVRVVFKDQPEGRITDFHFEVEEGGQA
ncbi:MAG: OB-fold domain-containing protein [Nocardioides sp.]|uniref:Zn-ribbon domain-containing OB-fold protein n=1 Tax=Nocardioides sp. TaxID=35761 RepID=UPI0039E67B0F